VKSKFTHEVFYTLEAYNTLDELTSRQLS